MTICYSGEKGEIGRRIRRNSPQTGMNAGLVGLTGWLSNPKNAIKRRFETLNRKR
jgi:hypothetical protein